MSFIDQISLATNQDFINKVQQAGISAAIAVSAEASSGSSVIDTARLNYATLFLRQPAKQARLMAYGVASSPSIDSNSTDSDIQFTVNTYWSAYSGVNVNQQVIPGGGAEPGEVEPKDVEKPPALKANDDLLNLLNMPAAGPIKVEAPPTPQEPIPAWKEIAPEVHEPVGWEKLVSRLRGG